MRIIRFNSVSNSLKVEPESFDDLYLLAMVISPGDRAEAKSYRRFKSNERDIGEQKEIFLKVEIEKVEIDKSASRLRLIGRILEGRPEEYINIGSHHTINIGPGEILDVQKGEWKEYILKRLKQAVQESRKPKLGVVVLDDEKALFAYLKGYGIEITHEEYSHLSKRMKEKEYAKQRADYFNGIIKSVENMSVDIIILAGPGFTKDDLKKFISDNHVEVKKRLFYTAASDAERSGIREVMKSDAVSSLLEHEHVKKEFEYLNQFMSELRVGSSVYGPENVMKAIRESHPARILVSDSVLNNEAIKEVLDAADRKGIRIEIFNSDDDAGVQLKNFKNIIALSLQPSR
jgi:protein pelota